MKKLVLLLGLLLAGFFAHAQAPTLYGTASNSGLYGGGSIYKYDVATGTKSDVFDFPIVNDREEPYAPSICELNGKLYGMCATGAGRFRKSSGAGEGLIYQYNPATNTHTVLYHFGDASTGEAGVDGGQPLGTLIPLNGKLYGVTAYGGDINVNKGVIFEYNPATNVYTKLKEIDLNFGHANTPLILGADGNFYGATTNNTASGGNDNGVIYKYNLATNTLSMVASFPIGATNFLKRCYYISQASNGKLYGIAEGSVSGSTKNVIFECDVIANTITQKTDFGTTTLLPQPSNYLYNGGNGNFYVCNAGSGGSIYEYNTATNAISTKFTFNATTGILYYGFGINPVAGKIYGHTISSKAHPYGEVFEYNYNTNTYAIDMIYDGTGYVYGYGEIFFASNNKAYSYCTFKPGLVKATTLQELDFTANTSTYKMEYNITAFGTKPIGNLLKGSDGKLYGTTTEGSISGFGCFFSFDPATGTMVNLKNFSSNIGKIPNADMVEVAGKIYGTTYDGGTSYALGTIFEYTIATNTYAIRQAFTSSSPQGYHPINGLMVGQNGKLYGLNSLGIFQYDTATNTVSTAYTFSTNWFDSGAFVEGASGVFYGIAGLGRYLTKVDLNTMTQSNLYDFQSVAGVSGRGKPLFDNNVIYCLIDGTSNLRFLKHDLATATNTVVGLNTSAIYASPSGGIIKASDNKMYFSTHTKDYGVVTHELSKVYELNPTTLVETELCSLEASMGHYPQGLLTEANSVPLSIKENIFANNFKIYPNPSNGNFNIEIDENLIGAKGTLYNLLGQKIKDFSLKSTTTNQTLNKGIYLLEIEKDGKKTTKKLIVN